MQPEKCEDIIDIQFKVELYNYNDYPIDYWEAKCKQLGLTASGKTKEEAKENLHNLILKTKFNEK